MKTKLLMSILMIGVVAMAAGAGTFAYFSDIERSSGNTLTAGTIDIAVGSSTLRENPWTSTYSDVLYDMKPCQVRETEFVIENVGENPAKVWKHITITDQNGGATVYPDSGLGPASSEPEYEEGLDDRFKRHKRNKPNNI